MMNFKEKFKRILYPPSVNVINPKVATSLFLILFSTQLTLTTPFSYLPAMVKSFGYKDRDRGYYAGMIASSLFVGRFFGGYFWGWLADKIGRRPVLLISASLTYIATVAFGFTTSFAWAVTTRFFQGLFNGVIVCGRAAFSEICDDTNQAIGVALVFAAWNSAIVLGPALGGFLAEPVEKYPSSFPGISGKFFTKFPYLLPSVLIASVLFLAILMIYFTFEETQPTGDDSEETVGLISKKDSTPNYESNDKTYRIISNDVVDIEGDKCIDKRESNSADGNNTKDVDQSKVVFSFFHPAEKESLSKKMRKRWRNCCNEIKSWSLIQLLSDKILVLIVVMFGISGFCIIGFSELRSLWMATNISYGGLTFSTDLIGLALLIPALVAVVSQPIIFGRMERKIGGIWTLRITLIVLAIGTFTYPYLHYAYKNNALLWSLIVIIGICRLISDISSRSCIALFINNAVHPSQTGRANGLAFSVQEIMRVASPTLFGSLFAWSINEDKHEVKFPLDYRLSFSVIAFAIMVILGLSFFLPKRINSSKPLSPETKK